MGLTVVCLSVKGLLPKAGWASNSCHYTTFRFIFVFCIYVVQKHRKQFSDAWLAFLRLPVSSIARTLYSRDTNVDWLDFHSFSQLSSRLYKRVLTSLHSDVMPHLLDPRLLLDFLTYSYDAGGVVSLLALNGLFILMHEYHL